MLVIILISVIGLVIYFSRSKNCRSPVTLHGKTVIVTGSNSGIGKATAKNMVERGAKVILACRDVEKGHEAASEITQEKSQVKVMKLDLSSFDSVRTFVKEFLETEERLDILINNAGVFLPEKSTTEDGFEATFQVNHLSHFLLTRLLLPRLKSCTPSRIVNVSSIAHQRGNLNFEDLNFESRKYSGIQSYCDSKLANVLFTKSLAAKVDKDEVTAYALHPGGIRTGILRKYEEKYSFLFQLMWFFGGVLVKSPDQGAQTTIYCSVDESVSGHSGRYYSEMAEASLGNSQAKDEDLAEKLWIYSEKATTLP